MQLINASPKRVLRAVAAEADLSVAVAVIGMIVVMLVLVWVPRPGNTPGEPLFELRRTTMD